MIVREATATARRLVAGFPVVAIPGPRQSGKTTLARSVFADKPYLTLEDPDERARADTDPRAFLARLSHGAVIDEAQRCPELFSYLQGVVDTRARVVEFVLAGWPQFGLMSRIGQSLAGRVGLLQLLPRSLAELHGAGLAPAGIDSLLWRGGYPALYGGGPQPGGWLPNHVATYVERDVRQLLAVRDLSQSQRFVACARRAADSC